MTMFTDFESINVGDSESLVKSIKEEDIRRFVEMTGDDNPLHVDRTFAESTSFKDIVVHGLLGASFISTVIGTKLPGPGALWLSQKFDFMLPVRLGDELTVTCTVVKKYDRERLLDLDTIITNQNRQVVLSGQGKVKLLAMTVPAVEKMPVYPKVAIVTGGSGGIGRAICLRLAKDGYNVVINYMSKKERAQKIVAEINAGEAKAVAIYADISTDAGVTALYKGTVREFGGVSLLVNNASPRINPKQLSAMDWSDFQQHLDVQLKGSFLITKACLPEMVERKYGRIINITSQVIEGAPSVTWTAYAVAKAALATFSRYLSAEYGPSGITVNCVSPGMTETSLIGDIPEKVQMMMARQTPLRRLASPDDVASAVSFLASQDSSFITGQTVSVNGGIVTS